MFDLGGREVLFQSWHENLLEVLKLLNTAEQSRPRFLDVKFLRCRPALRCLEVDL